MQQTKPSLTPGPIFPPPYGMLAARVLDDGRLLCILPLTYGRARLTLGPDLLFIETHW